MLWGEDGRKLLLICDDDAALCESSFKLLLVILLIGILVLVLRDYVLMWNKLCNYCCGNLILVSDLELGFSYGRKEINRRKRREIR